MGLPNNNGRRDGHKFDERRLPPTPAQVAELDALAATLETWSPTPTNRSAAEILARRWRVRVARARGPR